MIDSALTAAKQYLKVYDLDNALKAIDQSLQKRQQNSGSDLSVYGIILWCKILLTKGKFSKDVALATLAHNKLSEVAAFIPNIDHSLIHLPFHLLKGEAYEQLNQIGQARAVYENMLKISEQAAHDIGKIQALNRLAKLLIRDDNSEQALAFANRSLELLIQYTDEAAYGDLVDNYLLQSQIFLQKGDLSQAKNYAERAVVICQEKNFLVLSIQSNLQLGKVTAELKENKLAITHLLQAKLQSESINHVAYTAKSLLHIGIIYNQVFHYSKAQEKFQLVEKKYQKVLDDTEEVLLLNYLGKSYFQSFDNATAQKYFLAAEKKATQVNNKTALVLCLAYLGKICRRNDQYDRALRYAKRVNNLSKAVGDVDGVQVNLVNLGNIHNKLEKYSEGIKLTSRGIATAKRLKDDLFEIRGYQVMAEIFRKKKDYKSAVMYQMIYTKFYEDFYQRNERQEVADIEYQIKIDGLAKEINDLKIARKEQ
ncbi:MAG: hypothetical protein AAGJ18_14165 [Bacteroidota bacterium]